MLSPVAIDLSIRELPGFYSFISAWVYVTYGRVIVIDPGPTATIPRLLSELQRLGIDHIDYLLLTHIHIDHAGGTGDLVASFPVKNIICHPKAIRHLVDPTELNLGSARVLGHLMAHYQPIKPVPEKLFLNLASTDTLDLKFEILPSPGHAPHHISFLLNGFLFVGEALGVTYPGGENNPVQPLYLRPATPPRFLYEPYLESISRLARAEAHTLCFGHFGALPATTDIFNQARDQIDHWIAVLSSLGEDTDTLSIVEKLASFDQLFGSFRTLPEEVQQRELIFIKNTIDGIKGYMRNEAPAS